MEGSFGNSNENLTFINTRKFLAIRSTVSFSAFFTEFIQHTAGIIRSCYLLRIFYKIHVYLEEILAVRTRHQCTRWSFYTTRSDPWWWASETRNTGCFIMFSVITNIHNKKAKGPTLMEFFTATRKIKKFFLQLEMFDVCTTGDTAHIDTIFMFLPHTR